MTFLDKLRGRYHHWLPLYLFLIAVAELCTLFLTGWPL